MKLPIPFLKNKKVEDKYYLALLLEEEKITSIILKEEDTVARVVGGHTQHLETPLEKIPQEKFIELVDKVVSKAEEVLPPDIETHKTIFGVKEDWVDNETKKIKKEHLANLKKLCDVLDMTPIGFMVISEAIANLIQKEEGAPLSAVVAYIGKESIQLTLFRGGQVSETTSGPVMHSAVLTVDTLLKNFTAPVLPARIIISSPKNSKTLSQHFVNHEWSKSLPFLHVPQITTLPEDFDAKAVTYGASSQLGFQLSGLTDLSMENEEKAEHIEKHKDTLPVEDEQVNEEENVKDEQTQESETFGFLEEQDIAKEKPQLHKETSVASTKKLEKTEEEDELIGKIHSGEQREKEDEEEPVKNKTGFDFNKALVSLAGFIKNIKLPKNMKVPDFLKSNKGLRLPAIIAGTLIILIIALWVYYYYGTKAEIVLLMKPNNVAQEEDVTFSTTSGNDFSQNVISGKSISTSVDGDLSTPTTGKKDTGNKAKGSITVYNSSSEEQSLSSGTEVKSSNGLTFTLDKDINIASASGDIFSGTKPGTTAANVTAKDIGPDYNLPSGTKFAIGGNSNLAAKNDSAFSGGSKKTITVVGKDDLAKLKSDLPKKLEPDALSQLANKKEDGESVIPEVVDFTFDKTKFDKALDDEAKSVKLAATIKFDGISYKDEDMQNFDKSILKDHFSQDIVFSKNSLKNEISDAKVDKSGNIKAKVKIVAGLLPKIDKTEVTGKIKNQSANDAKKILLSLPQIAQVDINYSPNVFFISSLLPRLPKNLSVIVKSQ